MTPSGECFGTWITAWWCRRIMARHADKPTMLPVSVSSSAMVTSKACIPMVPHRDLPFGYPRFRCKPSARQTSLLCTRLARKFHETEDYTFYPAPIITVVKNRFIKHGLLMLAMLGVAYAIAVKGRALVPLNHFCLLQNINNKHKNT